MVRLKTLSIALAGCLLASGLAGGVSAQPRMDRDWDRRDWRDRDWDRDRDWERGPRWRDRDCYYERRRERNRFGDIVIRRYRVCEE
jgi:Ni/Co efflux regulator RcnB